MNGKSVLYNGQVLTLTKYFGNPCLFINNSSQMSIPKMQFVGGYPNEYCIYIKDLNESEKGLIYDKINYVAINYLGVNELFKHYHIINNIIHIFDYKLYLKLYHGVIQL